MRERPNHTVAGLIFVGVCVLIGLMLFFVRFGSTKTTTTTTTTLIENAAAAQAGEIGTDHASYTGQVDYAHRNDVAESDDETASNAGVGGSDSSAAAQTDEQTSARTATACNGRWIAVDDPSLQISVIGDNDTPHAEIRTARNSAGSFDVVILDPVSPSAVGYQLNGTPYALTGCTLGKSRARLETLDGSDGGRTIEIGRAY